MSTANNIGWVEYKEQILERLAEEKFNSIYGDLKNAKPSGDGWMLAFCPLHNDKAPSFGFNTKTGQWCCFSGCGKGTVFDYLMQITHRSFKEVLQDLGDDLGLARPGGGAEPKAVYSYRSEEGNLLFQVVKMPGKKFRQRRPNGNGGWVWNLNGVDRVLYQLPELVSRPDDLVYVAEGEKDVARLAELGLLATTSSGGAGNWKPHYADTLADRDVVILPDNDAPGRSHADQVATSLRGKAKSVRTVKLPDLPEKGDVSDWLDAGGTVVGLQELIEAPGQASRPIINIYDRQLRDIISDTWEAIQQNNDPPRLFTHAGRLARLVKRDETVRIEHVDEATAYGLTVRSADWVSETGKGIKEVKPLREIARDILVNPHSSLPVIEAILRSPVFDSQGRIITTEGFHPDARVFFSKPSGLDLKKVPTYPSEDDITAAVAMITDELFADFPFAAPSDIAHAMAAFLLPIVRRMISGPTPFHLIEAPTPGSGKTLLADLVSIIIAGNSCEATTVSRDESETRKKITALLARGGPIILLDNVRYGLDSSQLSSAITAETWSDRILGQSLMVDLPNRATWLITANNPSLSLEIARRCIRIRLDSGEDRPWQRKGFLHDPIRPWVRMHRADLLHALLVIVQNWLASGSPVGEEQLGSFESWSQIVGGVLHAAGVQGFLDDTEEFYEQADTQGQEWRAFVAAWYEKHHDGWMTTSQLYDIAVAQEILGSIMGDKSERSQQTRLGKALSSHKDRRFGDYKICKRIDTRTKGAQYSLHDVSRGDLRLLKGAE